MGWYEINGGIYGFNDDKVVGGESLKKLGVVLKNESRIRSRCDGKKKQVYDFFFNYFCLSRMLPQTIFGFVSVLLFCRFLLVRGF